jgi:hypothetical protein
VDPNQVKLKRVRYVGLTPMRLRGKTCLIMDATSMSQTLAQFDDLSEPESHGWHPFQSRRFRGVDRRIKV